MKRKRFKKETSLALMKGGKEIIDVHQLTHMDVILEDDVRPRVDSSYGRHIYCLRKGFKEKRRFRDKEMTIILGDLTRLYVKAKDDITLVF